MKVILSYDYLWQNVRVKGGAYGCMSNFNRIGEGYLISYRDPNLEKTMEIYEGAVENCKTAAADLASKWEGDAQKAFVAQQENAYSWHKQILSVVRQMIDVIRKAVDMYNEMEDAVKGIVQG